MIITSRKDEKGSNTARLQIKGRNLINDNLDLNLDYENIWENTDNNFMNAIYNKLILNDNYDLDEDYLLNSSFENDRSDFNIMYTDNYGDTIMDDMLSLEIKLLIEKMIDIQKSYHKELDLLLNRYNQNSNMMKSLIEKIKILQKKILLIKKIKESRENKENIYNFLEKYKHNNHDWDESLITWPMDYNYINKVLTARLKELGCKDVLLFLGPVKVKRTVVLGTKPGFFGKKTISEEREETIIKSALRITW